MKDGFFSGESGEQGCFRLNRCHGMIEGTPEWSRDKVVFHVKQESCEILKRNTGTLIL
jgi:hypothetical protein